MGEQEEQADYSKLDVEELIKHKNWQARQLGYEKLITSLGKADTEDPIFKQFASSVKNFVVETSPTAQDKGFQAALTFIDNAPSSSIGKIVGEVVANIVAKCFTGRPKAKEKGVEIMLLFFELEKQEPTLEELIKGLSNKSPKVVSGSMEVIREALRLFGPKIVAVKSILKVIPPFLEDRDKTVRAEARALIGEIYRWIGDPIKSLLQGVKPAQATELDAEYEKHKGAAKAVAERLVRSEQAKKAQQVVECDEGTAAAGTDEAAEEAPEINVADLADPVDVLKNLPDDFSEKVQSKKWQERKEVLDALDKASDHPKLVEGDFHFIVSSLKTVIAKDSNVNVIIVAGKCITNFAKGLRQKFGPHSQSCIPVILEKFKEKKPNVVAAMRDAVDACSLSVTLEQIAETILETLGHKTPSVKSETTLFLTRCFSKLNPEDLPKKQLKPFAEALIKNSNDPDQSVRDSAFEALGTAMKVVGEKTISPFLSEGVDEIKMKKIQEYCEKAVITAPKRKKPAAPPAAKAAAPPAAKTEAKAPLGKKPVARPGAKTSVAAPPKKPSSDPDLTDVSKESAEEPAAPAKKAAPKKSIAAPAKPAKAGAKEDEVGPVIIGNPKGKAQRNNDEKLLKVLKWSFTGNPSTEFVQQLKDQAVPCFAPNMYSWLFSEDFKNHLKAIDALQLELSGGLEGTMSVLDLILKWFTLRFFDTNPTVLAKGMDYLFLLFGKLGKEDQKLSEQEYSAFIPYLLLKSGDAKEPIREKVRAVVRQLCCLCPYSRLYGFLADGMRSKNAKQRSECVDLATGLVEADGMEVHSPNPQVALKLVASLIGDKDANVRNAALNNLLYVYQLIGDKLFKMVAPLNEKDRSMLDERIKRAPKKVAPPPKAEPPAERPDVRADQPKAESKMAKAHSLPVAQPVEEEAVPEIPSSASFSQASSSSSSMPVGPTRSGRTTEPKPGSGEKADERPSTVTLKRAAPPLLPVSDNDLNFAMSNIAIPKLSLSLLSAKQTSSGNMTALFSDLLGSHPDKTLQALEKITELLSRDSSNPALVENSLSLYKSLVEFVKKLNSTSMNATNYDHIGKCYSHVCQILRIVFENQNLADRASAEVLSELLYQLISILLDERMERMNGGQDIVKQINVIILKVIDNTNRTHIVCASIQLLRTFLGSRGHSSDRFLETVIKCVWRCVRKIPETILQLETDPIFRDLHLFFKHYPPSHWANVKDDTPFRTMKTIVYTLARMFGAETMNHLTLVDEPQSSELVAFLKRVIKAVDRDRAESGNHRPGMAGDGTSPVSNGNPKVHEESLSKIIQKVGSSDNKVVQQGLRELYEYKEAHNISLEGFLERTSPDFQKFVQEGVRMIEFEQKALGLPYHGLSEQSQEVVNRLRGVLQSPFITAADIENIKQRAPDLKQEIRNRCFDTVEDRARSAMREADSNMVNAENSGSPKLPTVVTPSRGALKISDDSSPSGRAGGNLDAVRARVKAYLQNKST